MALDELSQRLDQVDEQVRRRHAIERTLECRLPDLAVTFSGRLVDGRLEELTELTGLTEGTPCRAQIRFTIASDDLLAVTAGRLGLAAAWASGRLRVEGAVLDLLRMRSWI